jgi:2,3-bisphosphoglycerate-independent phosphoglycerate mutase
VTGPRALIILDGLGISASREANAVALADTPTLDRLAATCPGTALSASGEAVGLPEGQMGNSEVGHLNLGAGRTVYQDITRISLAVRDGTFFANPVLLEACRRVAASDGSPSLHFMGLASDGGVHSLLTHLKALIDMAKDAGVRRVYVHAFLDGRDVPPRSAVAYLEEVDGWLAEAGIGRVASVMGRYWAMDRDCRWERVERAYRALVFGEGLDEPTAVEAVRAAYDRGEDDEFVQPTVIGPPLEGRIRAGDSVVFFNFRPDRAREITRAFIQDGFGEFDRGPEPPTVHFTCVTRYDATFDAPVAFPSEDPKNVLADVLAQHGLTQVHAAETEKYAHVTFFFNGGVETPKAGEERILIPSPQVATYDKKPEMSAYGVTDAVIGRLEQGGVDVLIVNYANPDMVGHTGILPAAIEAVQAVDDCLGRVLDKVLELGGEALVTADHGNAERMLDAGTCQPHTAHTTDDVPLYYVGPRRVRARDGGTLGDVAPTLLELLALAPPPEMTGRSLLVPS